MTNEEVERAIQFILQQQAQFWASVESLKEIVRDHSAQIGELTGRIRLPASGDFKPAIVLDHNGRIRIPGGDRQS